jgi:hypothetical protein
MGKAGIKQKRIPKTRTNDNTSGLLKQLVSLAAIKAKRHSGGHLQGSRQQSERQNRAEKMPYYLYMRAAGGTETKL